MLRPMDRSVSRDPLQPVSARWGSILEACAPVVPGPGAFGSVTEDSHQ